MSRYTVAVQAPALLTPGRLSLTFTPYLDVAITAFLPVVYTGYMWR